MGNLMSNDATFMRCVEILSQIVIILFSLSITVLKKDKKIVSVVSPVGSGEEVPSRIVKEKLKTDDWKTYEHPKRGIDYIQLDVTEYSEKLGVGFAYDKLDN